MRFVVEEAVDTEDVLVVEAALETDLQGELVHH
jgi:hypothetical protein